MIMTTEQKAKAYDKALEKAKRLYEKGIITESLCHIFPELEGSEDEKIRKELIGFLRNIPNSNYTCEEMAAWLEKQGEERTVNYPIEGMFPYTDPADTLDGEIENIWNKLRNCDNTFTAAKSGFYEVIHHFANWLEKQGYTKKDVDDAYLKGICNTKHELEKQGDQKSVDKEYTFKSIPRLLDMIEPTDRAKSYCKKLIDSLQTEGYSVDAKIVGECLKQMNGEKVAMAVMDNEKQDEKKSQRMVSAEAKEALYDKPTDEEMKELLRTEYEKGRADTIAEMKSSWSEEDEKKPNGGIVLEDFNDGNGFYKVNLAYLNEEQVEEIEELVKRWGCQPKENEDESIISDLLDYFDEDKCLKHEVNDIVKWLKTIKPQPKQKLSDNEKKMLCNLIAYINNRTDLISEVKDTYVSWLKSLKDRVVPQPKHKWSIEDERVIAIINNALTESNTPPDDYDKVYDWLESLRKRIGE